MTEAGSRSASKLSTTPHIASYPTRPHGTIQEWDAIQVIAVQSRLTADEIGRRTRVVPCRICSRPRDQPL